MTPPIGVLEPYNNHTFPGACEATELYTAEQVCAEKSRRWVNWVSRCVLPPSLLFTRTQTIFLPGLLFYFWVHTVHPLTLPHLTVHRGLCVCSTYSHTHMRVHRTIRYRASILSLSVVQVYSRLCLCHSNMSGKARADLFFFQLNTYMIQAK